MRILHVCQPTEGGVAHQVAVLAKRHARKGHAVEVACPEGGGLARELRDAGIAVRPVPLVREPSLGADLAALLALRRVMEHGRFDVVHAHSAKAGALGRAAAWYAAVPAVYSPHAWSFLAAGSAPMRLAYLVVERVLARWATRQIICVSKAELELGRESLGAADGKFKLVPNGVNVPDEVPAAVEARRGRTIGRYGTEGAGRGAAAGGGALRARTVRS